jgi:predicted HD phosphohydrolase
MANDTEIVRDPRVPTDFDGEIAGSMAGFSAEYMTHVEHYLDEDLALVPDRVLRILEGLEDLTQGFQVTQLFHSLQTATRAERGGADLDMVVGSLCHDIGKAFSNANHPAIAAEMIRPFVSDDVYWIVKVHQDFQGLHYYARMGLDPMMRRKHQDHPAFELAAQFADDWDQTAFDPDYPTLPLAHFEPMVREVFSRKPRRG